MSDILSDELLAKVRNLPFDRLKVNGLRLKLFSFSVRGELVEPQKNTFARASGIKLIKGLQDYSIKGSQRVQTEKRWKISRFLQLPTLYSPLTLYWFWVARDGEPEDE